MGNIKLKNVSKFYKGGIEAIKGVNLNVIQGDFVVIVGPAGSGKSTLIRLIAGLEKVTDGKIYIEDKLANDIPPEERNIAMIYQNSALYPHMTVYDNLSFVMKLNRMDYKSINKKVLDTAVLLGIKDLLQCKPDELTEVQKQKVILGRAVVKNPDIILIDESATDEDKYEGINLIDEMMQIHKKTEKTIVYSMHNIDKALKEVSARIVILKDGLLQQEGFKEDIYKHPANIFVASLFDNEKDSFKNGVLKESKDNKLYISIGRKNYYLPEKARELLSKAEYVDKEVVVVFRKEELLIFSKETDNLLLKLEMKKH